MTGNPYALATALEKISGVSKQIPLNASPNSAHMFIIAPLLSGATFANLFSTHPRSRNACNGSSAGRRYTAACNKGGCQLSAVSNGPPTTDG